MCHHPGFTQRCEQAFGYRLEEQPRLALLHIFFRLHLEERKTI